MSCKRLETVDVFVREEMNLKVTCEQCGHAAVLDTAELRFSFHTRRLSNRLADLKEHLEMLGVLCLKGRYTAHERGANRDLRAPQATVPNRLPV